jgi:hypothetical protein
MSRHQPSPGTDMGTGNIDSYYDRPTGKVKQKMFCIRARSPDGKPLNPGLASDLPTGA